MLLIFWMFKTQVRLVRKYLCSSIPKPISIGKIAVIMIMIIRIIRRKLSNTKNSNNCTWKSEW